MLKRGIQLECLEEVFEIFDNHGFLRYFPHSETTLAATVMIGKSGEGELALKWGRILENNPLIKINERIREELKRMEGMMKGDETKRGEFLELLKSLGA